MRGGEAFGRVGEDSFEMFLRYTYFKDYIFAISRYCGYKLVIEMGGNVAKVQFKILYRIYYPTLAFG